MSSLISELEQVTEGALASGVGFGLALTAAPALTPLATALRQTAYETDPNLAPDVYQLAAGVAQGQVDRGQAQTWAHKQGISGDAFSALVNIANVGPGADYAFRLWRRGIIDQAGFMRALRRQGIEAEWIDDLTRLYNVLLTPSELANARQQGFVDAQRQLHEAELQGIDNERAEIQFELSGLPPGVDVGQRAANRGLVDRATFDRIVREGHTKTKYTDLLWAMRHPVLSEATYAMLHLKGYISAAEMNDGGALTGHTPDQMDKLFLAHGRPATTHQVHIGYARGGTLPGATGERDAFDTAVRESDIKPKYADLLWEGRHTLPTPFVMRTLTQTGVWSEAKAALRLRQAGWIPQDADEAAKAWAGGTAGPSADPHVTKAQNQLWTRAHSSYVGEMIDGPAATTAIEAAGVGAAVVPAVLNLWNHERALIRKQLTPAQVKKAYKDGLFTRQQALNELLARGYDQADAVTLLDE